MSSMNPISTNIVQASAYSFYSEDHTIQLPKQKGLDGGNGGAKIYGRDIGEFNDNDIDDLLDNLTMEELQDLNAEMDPDVSI